MENPKGKKLLRERERVHYNNGYYNGVSGVLVFPGSIDRPPRWRESTIYTGSVCLDKVVVSSSV